jgi:hypothetical protein
MNLKFEDLEPFENVQGPSHYLPAGLQGLKRDKGPRSLLGEQAVLQMTEEYVGKWHHVYFDHFFHLYKITEIAFGKEALCLWNIPDGTKRLA